MSFSNLDKEGLYDHTQRYRFTNIDDEEFVGMWNNQVFVRVPPGTTVTVPESQGINFGKALATRVMLKEEKAKFIPNMREATWEESQRSRTGIPMARDPYEKKILKKIEAGEETPEVQVLRAEMREELLRDMSAQVSVDPPSGPKGLKDLATVKDPRVARQGHEFEGVTALK